MDFENIFLNELDWTFAGEIALKTLIMFIFILIFLRLTGKKGVRQLSVFEVAIIISLGSAAGDPMANRDQPILPSLLVFTIILIMYRAITWMMAKSERVESLVEGDPVYVIEEGKLVLLGGDDQTYAKDEFFAEMRQQNIEHMGQVQAAVLETNGQLSFFYYADDEVKPGLPIWPKAYQQQVSQIEEAGLYACVSCGQVDDLPVGQPPCERCQDKTWVKAIQTTRRV